MAPASSTPHPKSAPATYMPSFASQMSPLGFDYTATQPRFPPATRPLQQQQQDFYVPRYGDPAPAGYISPSGPPGNYGLAGDAADQWATFPPVATPTRSPPKRGKSQKKADGKQATFLTKLYA